MFSFLKRGFFRYRKVQADTGKYKLITFLYPVQLDTGFILVFQFILHKLHFCFFLYKGSTDQQN